jgi:molecular chaperone DnaJ
MKDYYGILGVSKNCSTDELNKAYRELALKYHPDRNIDRSEEYSIKFKEIQEAYEFIIKNPKKFEFKTNSIDDIFDNIFSKFFGDQKKDNSSRIRIKISFEECYKGCSKEIEIDKHAFCELCQGTGGSLWEECKKCNNKGFVQNSTCVYCMGKGSNIKTKCEDCLGKGFLIKSKNKITISIPPGIEDNTQIRIANEGSDGGDLYVVVNVHKAEGFKRDNQDLICDLEVPYSKLVLGGVLDFKLFEETISIKIKPKTKSGSKLIIRNRGFSSLNSVTKGNLTLNIQVKLPEVITKEYKEIIEKLSNFENT